MFFLSEALKLHIPIPQYKKKTLKNRNPRFKKSLVG